VRSKVTTIDYKYIPSSRDNDPIFQMIRVRVVLLLTVSS